MTIYSANTYTGDTDIQNGTLRVNGSLSDNSEVNVGSSGIYRVQNSHRIASLTGDGDKFFPRPRFLSGCVTTAITS